MPKGKDLRRLGLSVFGFRFGKRGDLDPLRIAASRGHAGSALYWHLGGEATELE